MDYCIKVKPFDIQRTLLCGQAFRWKKIDENKLEGIVFGKKIIVSQDDEGVILHNINSDDIPMWENYFDVQTDYAQLMELFAQDETMAKAVETSQGIRLLRQEPFEMVISFIISQNNNIKRISGIVEKLCQEFGSPIEGGFAFPTPEQLADCTVEDLEPIRAGFRARYIIDAAKKVASGEVDLDEIFNLSYEEGKKRLLLILGIGDKVADCILLFGYYKMEAFPKDVWIKRAMAEFYPNGLPEIIKGYEGIAQQLLFDYVRTREERRLSKV